MSQQNSMNKTQQIYMNIINKLMLEIKEAATNEGCNEDTLKELRWVRRKKLFNKNNNIFYLIRLGKIN